MQSSIGEYAQAFQGLYNATAIFEDPNRGDSLVIEPACHDSHNGSLFLKMARAFRARVVLCSMREWRPGCLVRERICRSRLGQSETWGQGGNLKNPMPAKCDAAICHQRAELRPLQNLRYQGPESEYHLGTARGRGRSELPQYVARPRCCPYRGIQRRWTCQSRALIASPARQGHSAQCGHAKGVRPPDGVDEP